jgi:Dolichyl-phosphate-mannose-protein mannosyltransferase
MNYKKYTITLIFITIIAKLFIAASVELGNDEVYYRLYANDWQLNYFDHPPMVAWLIRFTTLNLSLDTEVFIRLGSILCSALATWYIYLCGCKIKDDKTGYFAACLFAASLYCSIIAGLFIMPDSPQILFWTISIYLLLQISDSKIITKKKRENVLFFGCAVGLSMLSKIHGIFLWGGFVLYLFFNNKRWFGEVKLYYAIGISFVFIVPILLWNINNNFITFNYHGNRVNVAKSGIDIDNFLQFNLGQFFYNNPINVVIIIVSLIALFKSKVAISNLYKNILLFTSLPLIIVATGISLFKQVLPHWTGPSFIGLILIAAAYLSESVKIYRPFKIPYNILASKLFIVMIVISGMVIVNFLPATLGKKEYQVLGDEDFTLDLSGWKKTGIQFDKIIKKQQPTNAIIISNNWFPAAHIEYYLAHPLQIPVIAQGSIDSIHQYHWWNKERIPLNNRVDAYVIIPSNIKSDINNYTSLINYSPTSIDTIYQYRATALVRYFTVYYYKNILFK